MARPRPTRDPLPRMLMLLFLPFVACSPRNEIVKPTPISGALSGTYAVEGITTPLGAEEGRPIQGTLILVEQPNGAYTSSFHLRSTYPGPDGNLETEVIGQGQGVIEERSLVGTADTQILTAAFPGVDAKFPFLPRQYGPRVVSNTTAEFKADGSVWIEIQTQAAEGQEYAATTTRMSGRRARPRGVADFPPVGAERMARQDEAIVE